MEEFRTKHSQKSYSLAFVMEVINEVQSGRISMTRAQRKYGIGGNTTIQRWIEKYGKFKAAKNKEIDRMSSLELENEKLRKEKQELESALAKAHLKILTLESLVEVYQEDQNKEGEKKSTDKKPLKDPLRKALGLGEDTQ